MNLNILTVFQQSILAILMLIGNVVFVSTFVNIIRRHFFKRKLNNVLVNSKASPKVRNEIEQEEEAIGSAQAASSHHPSERFAAGYPDDDILRSADNAVQPTQYDDATVRRRRKSAAQPASNHDRRINHHQTGLGFFPAPWQISGVRKAFSWLSRRIGGQPHEKNHLYFSFVPTLDYKVGFPQSEKKAISMLKLFRAVSIH